ncbi:MAG: CRISPR-associated protein Cas4 [Anaerolineae bacterium]|nr:CRISPR-associated protein Cas4 [Anaerolineae bacterium]
MQPETDRLMLTATDLKQYVYCPRKFFYGRCLPDFRPRMPKMDEGRKAHPEEARLQARRSLQPYGLEDAERRFDVRVRSERLALSGLLDEVIVTPEAAYPVDYKLASWASPSFIAQIAAYCLMIEDDWKLAAPAGFLVFIESGTVERVEVDAALRAGVEEWLDTMRQMAIEERMPPPASERERCEACEYRRLCGDAV